jgi:hypothetical protein
MVGIALGLPIFVVEHVFWLSCGEIFLWPLVGRSRGMGSSSSCSSFASSWVLSLGAWFLAEEQPDAQALIEHAGLEQAARQFAGQLGAREDRCHGLGLFGVCGGLWG